ncbi:MAG: hypothetical protein CBC12_12260 [Candidatus Puniceispirillum sp. TMED52]|nr:MAG: hypothetical protein CBC12_12260 [Candidatus Puniceispirillum sp. TMED52]
MELLAELIHLFFGKKDTAIPNERSYESDDPIYGTLTWSGKGRRPKWVDDYVNRGGSLDDLAVK